MLILFTKHHFLVRGMEEQSVCVDPAGAAVTPDSPSKLRSTMSTPKSPSESSDDCDAPDYKCAICLGRLRNKSLIDACFHEFCFGCLVEWSKIKAECPLCKTKFEYIIHNVRSNDDYEKYHCQSNQHINLNAHELPVPWEAGRVLPYRSNMNPHYHHERLALRQIAALRERSRAVLRRHMVQELTREIPSISEFRSRIYRDNLWVQPLSDITGRFRESTPSFYRANPAQVYRLVRWLQRELRALLPLNALRRTIVMQTIITNIFLHRIHSSSFYNQLHPYLESNTGHFLHEFAEYARSPFDMVGHDRAASYLPRNPNPDVEEVILNSPTSSEFSVDLDDLPDSSSSEVEIIEDSITTPVPLPLPGPSGVRRSACRNPRILSSAPIRPLSNEETHEIVSSSSSDECEIIGTFKPPTPEVIDILSSDNEIPQSSEQDVASSSVVPVNVSQDDDLSRSVEESTCYTATPDSADRLKITFKIEPDRYKPIKKRKVKESDERWRRELSCPSSSSLDSAESSSKRKALKSDSYGGRGRIPSVVVPQPSFNLEATSSRYVNNDVVSEDESEVAERSKKKKSKHSKKHKKSRRHLEDRDDGTSESSSSKRCKVCRHRHCRCFRENSKKYKRIKPLRKESAEEWDSASGSSQSKCRTKWTTPTWQSDSRHSDSSD